MTKQERQRLKYLAREVRREWAKWLETPDQFLSDGVMEALWPLLDECDPEGKEG